ncbi:hypothetical protein PPERSA_02558 [Pseudocohnilembus persalinus]|uniref:Uncharacterized protein n=1 Tax=Pseudocohnilembus persalinus TaxID=266149 RepID=A0A0V0R5B1_PSEPJ|nr:hypothetical protein PPERSA_02558 [Pseudocohnilembus persalinus]|eukprot:KRX09686.1 hypothetical protein PPERSA_02558 [Pseudocohnilembus persalinus]
MFGLEKSRTEKYQTQSQEEEQKESQEKFKFTVGPGFLENFEEYKQVWENNIKRNRLIPDRYKQKEIEKLDECFEEEIQKGRKMYLTNPEPRTDKEVLEDKNIDFDYKLEEIVTETNVDRDPKEYNHFIASVKYDKDGLSGILLIPNRQYIRPSQITAAGLGSLSQPGKVYWMLPSEASDYLENLDENQLKQMEEKIKEQQQNQKSDFQGEQNSTSQQENQNNLHKFEQQSENEIDTEELYDPEIANYTIKTPFYRKILARPLKSFKFNFARSMGDEKNIKQSFIDNQFFQTGAFYTLCKTSDYLRWTNRPGWVNRFYNRDPYHYITFSFPYY